MPKGTGCLALRQAPCQFTEQRQHTCTSCITVAQAIMTGSGLCAASAASYWRAGPPQPSREMLATTVVSTS
jgi:hypothetical protein